MATYLRSQTVIPTSSGLNRNVAIYTLHWKNIEATADRLADATTIYNRINNWITAMTPTVMDSNLGFASYMAVQQSFTDVYDLTETKPRVAIAGGTHSIATGVAQNGWDLPPEVALCVSMQSTRVSGVPQNRRRGRMYVGPLQVMNSSQMDVGAPSSPQCDHMCTITRTLLQPGTAAQPRLAVLSRQTWAGLGVGEKPPPDVNTGEIIFPEIPGNLPDALNNVVEFWCDNAWDTQRRRGLDATQRHSQPVP
jgi:hypothetical protein